MVFTSQREPRKTDRARMKVGLIQVDGKWFNLALLKLSRFHKDQGDEVVWIDLSDYKFDLLYGSKIFMGGSGYDLSSELPPEIEHLCPDYESFKIKYSIGYTSRGCPNDCGFCIVREKEGSIKEWANLEEFLRHDKVMLLDNNFLASPKWKKKLEFLIKNKIKVCFTQGLDIRLISDDVARLLAKADYRDNNFKNKRLYFAFDDPKLEKIVIRNVKLLQKYGIRPHHLLFYVLVGFNTLFSEDYHRFEVLRDLGCLPFIMIYNRKGSKKLRDFARWVNKRYYKVVEWKDYDSQYRRKKK